ERGEEPPVFVDAAQVLTDVTIVPEDRAPAISAFDRAVESVPLVHPANRCIRGVLLVDRRQRVSHSDFSEKRKRPVQDAAIALPGDDEMPCATNRGRLQPESVRSQDALREKSGLGLAQLRQRAGDDGAV